MGNVFQILDVNGNRIFDDSMLGLYAQYNSGNATLHNSAGAIYAAAAPPRVREPLVAIRPAGGFITYLYSDDTLHYFGQVSHASRPASNFNFPYATICQPEGAFTLGDNTYGLQVFNGAGVKTFDSNAVYFVIRDMVEVSEIEAYQAMQFGASGGFTYITKQHAYCANPLYIINNLHYLRGSYYKYSSGWAVQMTMIGMTSGGNSSLVLSSGNFVNYIGLADSDKSALEAMINASASGFPKYILVGEMKNL